MIFETPKTAYALTIQDVEHYTDTLFRFSCNRPQEFRFRSGEFVMITLPDDKPIWRAYSIASPSWHEGLEFYSIKVPHGPLTAKLQKINPDDQIWIRKKPVGTLVHDALLPGKHLYLLATGTGVAPFASIIRDPETYDKFDKVILMHTTRTVAELQYSRDLIRNIAQDDMLQDIINGKLQFYDSVTREQYDRIGRITTLIETKKVFFDLLLPPLDPKNDRAMICGSMAMLQSLKKILEDRDFIEGSNSRPGDFVIEKAFAE